MLTALPSRIKVIFHAGFDTYRDTDFRIHIVLHEGNLFLLHINKIFPNCVAGIHLPSAIAYPPFPNSSGANLPSIILEDRVNTSIPKPSIPYRSLRLQSNLKTNK